QVSATVTTQEGLHGTGSRYMPIVQIKSSQEYPRTVAVAGVYPGLTPDEFLTPQSSEPAELGKWQYDFTDPDGPQMGTVALPGSAQLNSLDDPVIVVARNDVLGIELPKGDVSTLVVADRADTEFEMGKFFVWQTPEGA
ncbi:unnamed protein product, partial [Phaeothamnion confervicola]